MGVAAAAVAPVGEQHLLPRGGEIVEHGKRLVGEELSPLGNLDDEIGGSGAVAGVAAAGPPILGLEMRAKAEVD